MDRRTLAACIIPLLCMVGSRGFSADTTNDAAATPPVWGAPDAAKPARQVGEIPLVMLRERDAIVLGTAGCPVALFGQKFWDLDKLAPNGAALPQEVEARQPAAISWDGKIAAVAQRPGDDRDAEVIIWNTRTGEEIAEIPAHKGAYNPDYLGFAGSKYLLTIPRKSIPDALPPLDLWNAQTGKPVRRMPCIDFNRDAVSATRDARYLALTDNTQVVVYDLEAAEPVCKITPPAGAPLKVRGPIAPNQISALAFSLDATQLAAVIDPQHPRLVIWNPRGEIVSDVALVGLAQDQSQSYQPGVIWSPDGKFILINGHGIWDVQTRRLLYNLPTMPGTKETATLLDNDRALMVRYGRIRPAPSEVLEIPWNTIHEAQAAFNGASAAALKPHQSVSVQISLKDLPDDPAQAKAALLTTLTDNLATQGITVAEGQSTVIQLSVEQSTHQEMMPPSVPARTFRSVPAPPAPPPAPVAVMITTGVINLDIHIGSDSKVIFHSDSSFSSGYDPTGKDKDTAARKSILPLFCMYLSRFHLPYYLSADGTLQLPIPTKPLPPSKMKSFQRPIIRPKPRSSP